MKTIRDIISKKIEKERTVSFKELLAIQKRHECRGDPKDGYKEEIKPFPFFALDMDEGEETNVQAACRLYKRWDRPYWGGGLASNRPWKDGEREALARMFYELTGLMIEHIAR